jgi:hypothetical protein
MHDPTNPTTPRLPRWDDYALESLGDLVSRLVDLTGRDAVSRHLDALKANGTYDPERHADPALYAPLSAVERLEVLALGEAVTRTARHPSYVHQAVQAGLSWEEISAALGCTPEAARSAYRAWADAQRHLHTITGRDGRTPIGLSEAEYAEACAAASRVEAEGAW